MLSQQRLEQIKEELNYKSKLAHSTTSTQEDISESIWAHPDDLEKNADLLNCLHDWNFPIFRFGQRAQKFILSQVCIGSYILLVLISRTQFLINYTVLLQWEVLN